MRLFSLLFASQHILRAYSWGVVGHEVVATIAQIHLNPTILPALCDVLSIGSNNNNTGSKCHLASIATWADQIRHKKPWSAPLHYIGALDDYPSQTCAFPGPRGWDGDRTGNVLAAIRNDSTLLQAWVQYTRDGRSTVEDSNLANEALKFLVHFLGDMHMPLHLTGRDRGGNSNAVLFGSHETNLHALWDTLLISQSLRTIPSNYSSPLPYTQIEDNLRGTIYDGYIRRIFVEGVLGKWKEDIPSWLTCPSRPMSLYSSPQNVLVSNNFNAGETDDDILCPYAWAKPIHTLNCEIVWPKALDSKQARPYPMQKYLQLDSPEYAGVIYRDWIIEKLLTQAGVRLAAMLNWMFADARSQDGLQSFVLAMA